MQLSDHYSGHCLGSQSWQLLLVKGLLTERFCIGIRTVCCSNAQVPNQVQLKQDKLRPPKRAAQGAMAFLLNW